MAAVYARGGRLSARGAASYKLLAASFVALLAPDDLRGSLLSTSHDAQFLPGSPYTPGCNLEQEDANGDEEASR